MPGHGFYGVINAFFGSGLSAVGLGLHKFEHNKRRADPSLPPAETQPRFILGYVLLFLGALSSVVNFGLLGQAAQAPFAAVTLGYNALIASRFLGEQLTRIDIEAIGLIVLGMVLCVSFADLSDQEYDLDELLDLFTRSAPLWYCFVVLAFIAVAHYWLARHPGHPHLALLAYGLTSGVSAGFTGLFVKASVEIVKSAIWNSSGDMKEGATYFFLLCLPLALFSQLYWLNQGLKRFNALTFVPTYQASITIGNLVSGVIFFDEFARLYSPTAQALFVLGTMITVLGVLWLLRKADLGHLKDHLTESDHLSMAAVRDSNL